MTLFDHDYEDFPELTNAQIADFGFSSPHPQITEDFEAEVVKVTDGDTVTLRTSFRDFDFPLRLLDINAPELSEGGEESKQWLKSLIEGEKVMILINKENRVGRYGRLLGHIIHNGLDVGDASVRLGHAFVFGKDKEHKIPKLGIFFDMRQWFKNNLA